MSTIKAENIGFSFGKRCLFTQLSFTLKKGQICAILGPNGAGKTTLLRCLMKTYAFTEGEAFLDNENMRAMKDRQLFEKISYVPQGKNVPGSFTVSETVLLGSAGTIGPFGVPGEKEMKRAEALLREFRLWERRNDPAGQLSGGELQLTLIARALMKEPEILVLDEPESGLDFKNQLLVLETLKALSARGMTVLFNTHYPEHAFRYADVGILLYGNGKAAFGPISEIITEENIKEAFGVDAKIQEIIVENTAVKSVVPIKIL